MITIKKTILKNYKIYFGQSRYRIDIEWKK